MAGGSYVGLDIGSNLIKVAEVRGGGGRIEVTALGIEPTPPDAFVNGEIIDAQLLGQAVKQLLKKAGVTTKKVISSVSGQSSVVVRVIEVPKMNEAELAETMKWEVERQVPFNASEVICDYKPIDRPEGGDGQNMEVLLAVAQQGLVDRHVSMLFAAGLKPVAIEVEPLAAGRGLLEINSNGAAPGHTVVVVNIGANNTDISIFRDKLISFPRTLPLAGDNLTRAIAEALQVDLATAENYKREQAEVMLDQLQQPQGYGDAGAFDEGFVDFSMSVPEGPPSGRLAGGTPSGRMPFDFSTPGDVAVPGAPTFDMASTPSFSPGQSLEGSGTLSPMDTGFLPPPPNLPVPSDSGASTAHDPLRIQIFNAIAPVLAELVQELRRSIDYYQSRAGDSPIHEILLIGGTAKLKNLAPFLEMELGISTKVANPLQNVQVTSKNFSQGHLEEIASLFPVCLGLGVRDLIAPAGKKK